MYSVFLVAIVGCVAICGAANVDLYASLSAANATTFKSLVDQAGLQSLLQSTSDYTLLVPTDAAFAKIPAQDLQAVTSNPSVLLDVLKYHMISGTHMRKEFLFGRHYFLNSTNGHPVRVYRTASGTHFNHATAVKTDINATNGVIHLINGVLEVPEGTVVDILGNPDYNISSFLALVRKAKLSTNYNNPTGINRYTMFAPSNKAIAELSNATINSLTQDTTNLRMLIEYHVHSGTLHASSLAKRHTISTTLPAHNITVSATAGVITLNNVATVTMEDIEAENGVVYVISKVLRPAILEPIIG